MSILSIFYVLWSVWKNFTAQEFINEDLYQIHRRIKTDSQ